MSKNVKLRKFLSDSLYAKFNKGYGNSKDKGVHNETAYIHSHNTYKTYRAQCNHFCDWCYSNDIRTAADARRAVPDYVKYLQANNKSAWSVYTAISAIAKAFSCSTTDFDVKRPPRTRASVRRSRYAAVRDKQFCMSKEENKQLVNFCRATGLRRRELEQLRGNMLHEGSDGKYYIHVKNGKGGKERDALVIGSDQQIKAVCERMRTSGDNLVFMHVHTKLDVHYYRSLYACDLYRQLARDTDTLQTSEKYICRKDRAGVVYDRAAMQQVSHNLGHNRIDVIASSYLHNL